MPAEPELHGLLALMLLHDARREARFAGGEIVLLEDQDGSLWDAAQIADGRSALDRALALSGRGPYALQATVALLQTEQPIDWPQTVAIHDSLAKLARLPVVELNRAVAIAEAGSPMQALQIVEQLALEDLSVPALDASRATTPTRAQRGDP